MGMKRTISIAIVILLACGGLASGQMGKSKSGPMIPSMSGQTGKYLSNNGSAPIWDTPAGGGSTPTAITVSDNQTDTTEFVGLFGDSTGDVGPRTRSTLTYNAVTGLLSSTLFSGAFNGTVGETTPAAGAFTTIVGASWSLPVGTTLRTVASATTPDLGNATSEYVEISGAVTITGFASARIGTVKFLRFTGAPQLTYNGTSFILPASRNIQLEAGDRGTFASLGSGNWVCLELLKASGRALGDQIITTHSTTEAVSAITLYGNTHLVTAAATPTPVAGVIRMRSTFIATTGAVFSIDCNAADHFVLGGTALTAGNKITSDGFAGSFVTITFTAANTWTVTNTGGLFIDGGA
jgi:hypothetical protein